jgi:hypothetical protein
LVLLPNCCGTLRPAAVGFGGRGGHSIPLSGNLIWVRSQRSWCCRRRMVK